MTTALTVRGNELDRYVAEANRYPILDRDEELRLARRLHDKEDVTAAHLLVVSNLRFVVKVAHQYRGYGLKLLDLIQEGNIGLMKAVKKFDPERGYRLISYAVWWIRAQIHDYLLRSWSLVKLGSGRSKRKLFFKLRSERSRLQREKGSFDEELEVGELANRLGVSEADVSEMEVRLAGRDFSLDTPVGEDSGTSHLEMLDDSAPDQEEWVSQQEERKLLNGALAEVEDELNEKERYLLDHRLLADEPETLAEVGSQFGVSRERARQIEAQLIGKLRGAVTRAPRALPAMVSP